MQAATVVIPDDPRFIEKIFNEMKESVKSGETVPIKFREKAIDNLLQGYQKMKPQIDQALKKDLGYNQFMSNFAAHSVSLGQIKDLRKGLSAWAKPKPLDTPLALGLASSQIQYEPLGLVLVVSAWNYPIYTALPQVAAGIAAGNSVILKPSQLAPYTSNVLEKLFDQYLDKRSTQTGRLVAMQAAKNLTPCLLELGGKCPVIIDETAKIDNAVKRVIFGKFLNCGQTCVGVDHIYVHESIIKVFEKELLIQINQAYGKNLTQCVNQGSYGKIININQFKRLQSYLQNDNHKGNVLLRGQMNPQKLTIMPTVVESPHPQSALMNEQIFGPILPIIPYHNINNVISEIQSKPKPLVVYLFSEDSKNKKLVKEKTRSGSFVLNDAVVQLLNCHLPFGGVGSSGYGRYHGQVGFQAFSNPKSICETKAFNMYPLNARFAPYTDHKKRLMVFLLKVGGITYSQLGKGAGIVAAIVAAAIIGIKMKPKM